MSHQITDSELVGEYKTLLASDSEIGKNLFHVLTISDNGGSVKENYLVTVKGFSGFEFSSLWYAINWYNQFVKEN